MKEDNQKVEFEEIEAEAVRIFREHKPHPNQHKGTGQRTKDLRNAFILGAEFVLKKQAEAKG